MRKILAALTMAAFTLVVTPTFAQPQPTESKKEEKKESKKKKGEEKKEEKKQ